MENANKRHVFVPQLWEAHQIVGSSGYSKNRFLIVIVLVAVMFGAYIAATGTTFIPNDGVDNIAESSGIEESGVVSVEEDDSVDVGGTGAWEASEDIPAEPDVNREATDVFIDDSIDTSQVDEVIAAGTGYLGVALYDTKTAIYIYINSDDYLFQTQSISKILMAMEALEPNDDMVISTDPDYIFSMLAGSDDDMASGLWGQYGGTDIVNIQAEKMGLINTQPPLDPGWWGQTLMSVPDIVRMYQYLAEETTAENAAIIVEGLRGTNEYGNDGFYQHFGIPDAAEVIAENGALSASGAMSGAELSWAVKQGWGCCDPVLSLNTSGFVGTDDRFIAVIMGEWQNYGMWQVPIEEITDVSVELLGLIEQIEPVE